MIRRLTLVNFMAHGHTVLDLAEGVTVLTGPNNAGKSAVVEALRCLSENPGHARQCIRHGAAEAEVAAELEDGVVVRWKRKKTSASYHIERPGQETESFYKLGQGVAPEEVQALLRLRPVRMDKDGSSKDNVDVHLGDQRSPIFLVNRPGSHVAHFFAASSEGVHLLAMQDRLKARVQEAKKELAATRLEQAAARSTLDRLAALPALQLALEEAEAERERLDREAAALPVMARRVADLRQALRRRAFLRARIAAMADLPPPPLLEAVDRPARLLGRWSSLRTARTRGSRRLVPLEPLQPPPALEPAAVLADWLHRHALARRRAVALARRREALSALLPPPDLESTSRLALLVRNLARLRREERTARRRLEVLTVLAAPPAMHDAVGLAGQAQRLRVARRRLENARTRLARLETLSPPPELHPLAPLRALLESLSGLGARRVALREKRDAAEAALAAHLDLTASRLQAIGRCPTCQQPLDAGAAATFLEGGHGH